MFSFPGSAWERLIGGSASSLHEAEPRESHSQVEPGNEGNHSKHSKLLHAQIFR
jgi:hypothetical protein